MSSIIVYAAANPARPVTVYLHHNREDYVSHCVRVTRQFYEEEFLHFLLLTFGEQVKGQSILDIGANIGNHSLYFASFFECEHVHAFEPVKENMEVLQLNLNGCEKFTLHPVALSDHDGQMILYNTEKDNYGGFSLTPQAKSFVAQASVSVQKLDDLDVGKVGLMKIDVENHELEVLKGAETTIRRYKPVICLENSHYYFPHIFPDPDPHAEYLQSLGYVKRYANAHQSSMDVWVYTP